VLAIRHTVLQEDILKMKKLFVLFLLISLVPFTVGCSLFGDDDDDSAPVNVAKLSAAATLPASAGAANLRGVAVAANKFKNVKMKIGGVTLDAVTEEPDSTSANYTVTFEKVVSTAEYNAATTGVVPVIITKNDGNTIEFAVDYSTFSSSPLSVSVDTNNNVSSSGSVYAAFAKASITESKNTLTPEFTVVFDRDIVSTETTAFDVKVTSGTTTVAASKDDFNVSYTPNTRTMIVSLKNKTLTDGKTYTVTINKLVSSSTPAVAVLSTSYTFTVKLTQ